MQIDINSEQAQVLREILQSNIKELRIESARTDSPKYRDGLHHREALVTTLLEKLES